MFRSYLPPFLATRSLVALLAGSMAIAVHADDMTPADHAKSLSVAFRRAAQAVKPAVVTINTTYKLSTEGQDPLRQLRRPGGAPPFPQEEGELDSLGRPTGIGSGLIFNSEGVVLTNNHVVSDAEEVIVRLSDGSEYKAVDIRTDPASDLAVLRIKAERELPQVSIGQSSELEIGDWVIAVGSPFDLEATVSAGIISAKGRQMPLIERSRLLQTDAAINPGNSGGPLANLSGEVIGINTAIATHTGSFQGVGFAIPIDQAKWIAQELLDHGKVRRAWLGISIGDLTAEAARRMNLPARAGVWVTRVGEDTPAGRAGMKANDVIVEFAKSPVRAPGDLQAAVEQQPIGSTQAVSVIREGKTLSLDVSVEALPDSPDRKFSRSRPNRGGQEDSEEEKKEKDKLEKELKKTEKEE